jgi:hypothetical protein
MSALSSVKTTVGELYDPSTRPELVKGAINYIQVPALLGKFGIVNGSAEKVVDVVAQMTTVQGLKEKTMEGYTVAKPYIAKARDPEGRKEIAVEIGAVKLVNDVKGKIDEKVLTPVGNTVTAGKEYVGDKVTGVQEYAAEKVNSGKEYVAPYVAAAKEKASPYVETAKEKYEKIRRSERVEAMITAFQEAREHPAEKVGELRSKAVDLIKYENLRSYRDHVMSAEFQADTARLIKHDLPALAMSGVEGVKSKAINLAADLDAYKEKAKASASNVYQERVPSKEDLKAAGAKVKETTLTLVTELQSVIAAEAKSGYQSVKTEGFSLSDVVERLKRVYGVVDTIVVTPLITHVKGAPSTSAPESEPEVVEATPAVVEPVAAPAPAPTKASKKKAAKKEAVPPPKPASVTDEDEMHDAHEDIAVS